MTVNPPHTTVVMISSGNLATGDLSVASHA